MTPSRRPVPPFAAPIDAFGATDPGTVRPNNEDALLVRPDLGVFAVADGVGGGADGEVASAMVMQSITDALENPDDITQPPEDEPDTKLGAGLVIAGLRRAHRLVVAHRLSLGATTMASTFAGIAVSDDGVTVLHAGDSRVYRFRSGRLFQLTEDHSLVNELLQRGIISAERAAGHPHSSIITRAVGAGRELHVEVRSESFVSGDAYLITSDGLHGVVGHGELESVLRAHEDLERAVHALVERAKAKGGPDNITAVLVRLDGAPDSSALAPPPATVRLSATTEVMKIKARDGKTYDVDTAPPGGSHEVRLDGAAIGSFVLEPDETVVSVKKKGVPESLLVDIADRFVAKGGGPMGIA
jgi:protein phosphatase